MLAHLRHRKVIIDPGMAPELMVSKRVSKLSKSVSKLKSESKSPSAFHSSLNCGIVVVNAVRNESQHLMHFIELRSAST